jgi:hypothetical protein
MAWPVRGHAGGLPELGQAGFLTIGEGGGAASFAQGRRNEMKKRQIAAALAAAALTGSMLSIAAPAAAHDGGGSRCVTKHEWSHAKVGVRKSRVHAIFDTRGRFVDGHAGGYTRGYPACAWTNKRLFVGYDNYKVHRVAEKQVGRR